MFHDCKSLSSIPVISNWKIKSTDDLNDLFYGCLSLSSLPDISKCNKENKFENKKEVKITCISLLNK